MDSLQVHRKNQLKSETLPCFSRPYRSNRAIHPQNTEAKMCEAMGSSSTVIIPSILLARLNQSFVEGIRAGQPVQLRHTYQERTKMSVSLAGNRYDYAVPLQGIVVYAKRYADAGYNAQPNLAKAPDSFETSPIPTFLFFSSASLCAATFALIATCGVISLV